MENPQLTLEQLREFRQIYLGHGGHIPNDAPILAMFQEFERMALLTSQPSHFANTTLFTLTEKGNQLGKALRSRRDLRS